MAVYSRPVERVGDLLARAGGEAPTPESVAQPARRDDASASNLPQLPRDRDSRLVVRLS